MSFGITYTLPHDVYPRYGYLQSWTRRLFKRFEENIRKIGTIDVDACVCDVFGTLKEIKQAEQCLQKPIVTVFTQKQSQLFCLGEDLVKSLEPFRYKKLNFKEVTWNDFIQDGEKDNEYNSKILVVIAGDTDQELLEKLAKLTQTQKENTFIYNPSERSHRLFKTVPELKSLQGSLSENIQSVLELKVVMVLEKIANYMKPLIPMEGHEQDKSLLDYIAGNLEKLNQFGIKDHLPKVQQDETLSKADDFFSKPRNGEEMEKLGELVARMVKCLMIAYLSRMYGFRSMVMATLVSDDFFNFEKKFVTWISKGKENQITAVLKKCKIDSGHLIHDVEIFIQEKNELLENVRRHQFELHGLLRQSTFSANVMKETKLSNKLQDELLREEAVTGCGTIYGILTLHASTELTLPTKENIKQILQKYNYHKGYKVQLVTSRNKKHVRTDGFDKVENGFRLNAKCANAGNTRKINHGTLGCFVKVKWKSSSPPQNQGGEHLQQESSEESELHCITCAHCVENCNKIIESDDRRPFAEQQFYFRRGDRYDIALLKVIDNRRDECILEMRAKHKVGQADVRHPWHILQNTEMLAGKPVYKIGINLPHFTYGVIASDNFKKVNESNENNTKGYQNSQHTMDPDVNLIIGADEQFSRGGDSGSVICDRNITEGYIEAIAILHGEIAHNGKWLHSYSALLNKSFQKLSELYQIEIQAPTFKKIASPFRGESQQQEGAEGEETLENTEGNDTMQNTAVGSEPLWAKDQEILENIEVIDTMQNTAVGGEPLGAKEQEILENTELNYTMHGDVDGAIGGEPMQETRGIVYMKESRIFNIMREKLDNVNI